MATIQTGGLCVLVHACLYVCESVRMRMCAPVSVSLTGVFLTTCVCVCLFVHLILVIRAHDEKFTILGQNLWQICKCLDIPSNFEHHIIIVMLLHTIDVAMKYV